MFKNAKMKGLISGYNEPFIEISDVYDHQWADEDKKIAEKMDQGMVDYCDIDGKKYFISYGVGAYGITYIPKLVQNYLPDGELPRTTDELKKLCADIVSAGSRYKPFIFSGKTDYWYQIMNTWWAQYEGRDNYDRYFRGKVIDEETQTEMFSPKIFSQTGRLRAYQAANDFIGLSDDTNDLVNWQGLGTAKPADRQYIVAGSSSLDFMAAQRHYFEGQAAMMVNGCWLENEMTGIFPNGFPNSIDMMQVPVISAIRENLPDKSVESDAELSALIKAIDAGSTELSGEGYSVTQRDFDRVKEARLQMYITGEAQMGIIPATTNTPNIAKTFLKFMYSDDGIEAYGSALSGQVLPVVGYDYEQSDVVVHNASDMLKTSMKMVANSSLLFIPRNDPLVYDAGLPPLANVEVPFAAQYEKDRKTPSRLFMETVTMYSTGTAWQDLLKRAGHRV